MSDQNNKTSDIDALARGANPRERIAAPAIGERCPRCHRVASADPTAPCALCAPHLVPFVVVPPQKQWSPYS